jgi:hypothetical protein
MRTLNSALLAPALLLPAAALAQSGYVSPDGKDRYPAVTIFCPSGTGVAPCAFGGGGGSGDISVYLGGSAVGAANRFPVADSVLEALITGGALKVGGSVSISGTPSVTLSGAPSVSLAGALPAGPNAIGSVSITNFPATQTVGGSVSISGTPSVALAGSPSVSLSGSLPAGTNMLGTVGLTPAAVGSVTAAGAGGTVAQAVQGISGGVPLTVAGQLLQSGTWNVGVSSLPALSAGSNAIGSVSVSNFPTLQPVSGSVAVSSLPSLAAGTSNIGTVGLAAGAAGSVTAAGSAGSVAQAIQGIAGGVALPVSGTFWQATQAVSVSSLPLPTGAALDSDLVAPYAPVAPAAATATKSLMIGCLSNTTLPSFAAGQEGAVPCDTSGRPYVVTVPSANNVPGYLQAVSTGGATPAGYVNAAGSCMATNVKSTGGGMVFAYSVSNSNTTAVWFRLFASATAPTCGSTTPTKRIFVPAASTVGLSTDLGWVFAGGIGFDVTAGSGADTDATTVATANSVLVNIDYK